MLAQDLIQTCADGINDPNCNVITAQEWQDLVNDEASELFPEIAAEVTYSIATNTIDNYLIDLSGATYTNIDKIKSVWLEDSEARRYPYDNWIYDKTLAQLNLNPPSEVTSDYDPEDYDNIVFKTLEKVPAITGDATDLLINDAQSNLLKKICIKEAVRRILLDHTKLDRYRTLVGRSNEYVLLGIIRDLTLEIERAKSKLRNTNEVRSF
jgi:hypothetical protein